jgi:hypothetical protein
MERGRLGIGLDGTQTLYHGEHLNNFLARVFEGTKLLIDKHRIPLGEGKIHWNEGNVPAGKFILGILCVCCSITAEHKHERLQ